jgi:hypothetical protein
MYRTKRVLACCLAAMAGPWLITGTVGAASAAAPTRVTDTHDRTFVVPDYCGFGVDVLVHRVATSSSMIRTGPDGQDYWLSDADVVETRTANGVTTTYVEHSTIKDLSIAVDADGAINIVSMGVGNAVLYGPDGEVLGRNPGQSRFLFVFDPLTWQLLSVETVKESTGRTDDQCAAQAPFFST